MFFNLKFTKMQLSFVSVLCLFFSILTFENTFSQVPPTSATERLNGLTQKKLLREQSLLKDIDFRNIGPSVMSGRIVDISVNPNDPTEFYVAYATGGLWHTTNNGQSFVPVFDHEDVIGIGAVAVDWLDGAIWVGTGEANSSRSSYAGLGVYKSVDTGKTWQYLGLPESEHIGKIILDPRNKKTAWVAAIGHLYSPNPDRGVYKTTDGGLTWQHALFVDDSTGAIDLDINPKNSQELYASMWHRGRSAWNFVGSGNTSSIYKSVDGGGTWHKITGANTGFPQDQGTGRIGIAVYAGNPQIVYASLDNQNHRPDTASKKQDTAKYRMEDFKNITREKFLSLDGKKLDSFFLENDFDEKYNDSTVKELVRSGTIKATDLYLSLIHI